MQCMHRFMRPQQKQLSSVLVPSRHESQGLSRPHQKHESVSCSFTTGVLLSM